MDLETDRLTTTAARCAMVSPSELPRTYQPEQWRHHEESHNAYTSDGQGKPTHRNPDAREQSRLLDLLGRINHRILTGNRVYIEVEGVVYKTLYGGYWCSVFTGIQHYLLRCEQIQTSMWTEENAVVVDLPIDYANGGWTTQGCSLSFLLTRDQLAAELET